MTRLNRRSFAKTTAGSCAATIAGGSLATSGLTRTFADTKSRPKMAFGLVTYLWGKDMDLETLIKTCEQSGVLGVEVRTQHAHGIEPSLNKKTRKEIRKRFADSPVELVGYGSNAQYHESDPAKVRSNIELTKKYIDLMHDCGGTGVKVKPNGFAKDVAKEKTIEQIGNALNEVAAYGESMGQQIRVEVHGKGTSSLPVIRDIFEVADHSNATVCWNCNDEDLAGQGLEHNFNLVKDRFGKTVHVRELNVGSYPYADLIQLFTSMKYAGWILLEARTNPSDKVAALIEQREIFEKMAMVTTG